MQGHLNGDKRGQGDKCQGTDLQALQLHLKSQKSWTNPWKPRMHISTSTHPSPSHLHPLLIFFFTNHFLSFYSFFPPSSPLPLLPFHFACNSYHLGNISETMWCNCLIWPLFWCPFSFLFLFPNNSGTIWAFRRDSSASGITSGSPIDTAPVWWNFP